CDLEYIPARNIESCVLGELRKFAAHPDLIEKYLAEQKTQEEKLLAKLRGEKSALQHKQEALTRTKDAKVRWLAETLPDKAVAGEVGKEISRKLDAMGDIGGKLKSLDRRIAEAAAQTAKPGEIAEFLKRFDEGLDSLSVPQKRRLVQSLVKEVTVQSLCEAKVVFSIPSSGLAQCKTGPEEAPFLDGELPAAVPTHLLPPAGPGYPPHTRWLPD
ncbi:MAG: hypothetical protein ABII00_04480, partial [Elusimicrobiota bacterium]